MVINQRNSLKVTRELASQYPARNPAKLVSLPFGVSRSGMSMTPVPHAAGRKN